MQRLRFAERAANRGLRCRTLALREPQQWKTRLQRVAVLAGSTVGRVGFGEPAAQPVNLRQLVERGAARPRARALRFRLGLRPRTAQSEQLHAVHETYAAKHDGMRVCIAPPRQRVRPFARASEIEEAEAALDHGAVNGADADGRHIADRDRDHDFVEHRRSRRGVTASRHDLRKDQSAEDLQFGIAETPCDVDGARRCVVRSVDVLLRQPQAADQYEQKSLFRAAADRGLEEVLGPREPAVGLRPFAPDRQIEGEPERAARRASHVPHPQPLRVRTRPGVRAYVAVPDHVRADGELLEILGAERRAAIVGRAKSRVRVVPRMPRERFASRRDLDAHFSGRSSRRTRWCARGCGAR